MDIRDRFRKQQKQHDKPEPKPEPVEKVPKWQLELMDRLADRLEDVISRHGGVPVSADSADGEEKRPEKPTKTERPRISFDDFSGILDMLNAESARRQNDG